MKKLILCLILTFVSTGASADIIKLKSGRVIQGNIAQITDIYVRLEYEYGQIEREFLIENIADIEQEMDSRISRLAVMNIKLRSERISNSRIKKAAMDMAAFLVENAVKSSELKSLDKVPDEVKTAVIAQANILIEEAVKGTKIQSVKKAAEEKAVDVIEEAVKSTNVQPFKEMPSSVKTAAEEKATVVLEEAVKSVKLGEASSGIKTAANDLAVSLVENALNAESLAEASSSLKSAAQKIASVLIAEAVKNAEIQADKRSALELKRAKEGGAIASSNVPESVIYVLSLKDQILLGSIILLLGLLLLEKIKQRKREGFVIHAKETEKESEETQPVEIKKVEPEKYETVELDWSEKDRRKHDRIEGIFPILISLPLKKLKPVYGEIQNLSLGGSYVICNERRLLKPGKICKFKIALKKDDAKCNVEGRAIVVRTILKRALGLRFFDIDRAGLLNLKQCFESITQPV